MAIEVDLPADGERSWGPKMRTAVEDIAAAVNTTLETNDALMASIAADADSDFSQQMAGDVTDPATPVGGAISVTIADAGAIESTQRTLAKIEAEIQDVALLIVGDSTSNETTEWVYLFAQMLASDHPTHAVAYRLWDDGTTAYGTATLIQSGTGARTITLYNASVAGFSTTDWQGLRAATAIYALTPDMVLLSLGHNEGTTANDWYSRYVSLSESITTRIGGAELIVVAQNPATANTYQQQRREVYREIAAGRGYGFIDVCQAFLDTGDAPGLTTDGTHPTPTGSALWATTVHKAFSRNILLAPRPQVVSPLASAGVNLLRNSDFASGETYWTLSGCTSAVDTTNFETATNADGGTSWTSTARKFTASGSGQATLSQYVPHKRGVGGWVTLAVRIYVPTGQAANVGRVGVVDSAGSTLLPAETGGQGAFRWVVASRFVPSGATYLRVLIYIDATNPGAGNCTIDRMVLTPGRWPRDLSR